MKKVFAIIVVSLTLTSCSSWNGAYIQFQDNFYKNYKGNLRILILPPNSLIYKGNTNKMIIDYSSRMRESIELEFIVNEEWINKNENIIFAKSINPEKPSDYIILSRLQKHILRVNSSQNLVPVTYDRIGGLELKKELFVSDPNILPDYQYVSQKYKVNLVGVFYTFTGKKNKKLLCFTLVDLSKDRIVYRMYNYYSDYGDLLNNIKEIKEDIGL